MCSEMFMSLPGCTYIPNVSMKVPGHGGHSHAPRLRRRQLYKFKKLNKVVLPTAKLLRNVVFEKP